jgi:hypothetical protein
VAPFDLPEGELVRRRDLVAAPGVVDEQIEPPLLVADAVEERLDLRVLGVVAADRYADAAAGGQLLGGVVDRAGASKRRRLAADAATADVDRRPLLAENEGDALAAATARAGDERNLPIQLLPAQRPK